MTERIIALAGNPNVGKSTIFNALTGLRQHTGNWPGKTVTNARGHIRGGSDNNYLLIDVPGCYSLMANSREEEVARDCICFENPDAVIIVCDATCVERNLNLVLQIMEATPRVIVCVNLMDEARRKHINVDTQALATRLGVPVIATSARSKSGLNELMAALDSLMSSSLKPTPHRTMYPGYIEHAITRLAPAVRQAHSGAPDVNWICARLLDANDDMIGAMRRNISPDLLSNPDVLSTLESIRDDMRAGSLSDQRLRDDIANAFVADAEAICHGIITHGSSKAYSRECRLDALFTSRITGFPIMALLLTLIFWITIVGANYPSALLSEWLFGIEDNIYEFFKHACMPTMLNDMLVHGMYRVMAWVISVMLPPMAIFFPLFTLLEDFGYLPRVAFNMDRCFQRCHACGKQALTMCLGLGCNAVGVTGCRIIDSPRERMIAIITNVFMPCNGRFPTMISIITMFLISTGAGILSAMALAVVIMLGLAMTLIVSWGLSKTILKGMPSSFTLELPPYRMPQVGKVIARSMLDRVTRVLGRAIVTAAPAGLVIWVMANISVGSGTMLSVSAAALDPFGRQLGMDGVILLAFILGLPANEIVMPIAIMAYMAQGSLIELGDIGLLRQLLVNNGWTWVTAVSTLLFSLMHWPCATTCLTIRRETGSWKWTLVSILVPTLCGLAICFGFAQIARLF